MKEFYFKKENEETYFFFRNKNRSKLSYCEWKKECDRKNIKENNTLEELFKFLNLDLKNEVKISVENLKISLWENEDYKFKKITFKSNPNLLISENKIIYELEIKGERL